MIERKSLKWPITLAVIMLVCLVSLTVGWVLLNVAGAKDSPSSYVYWIILSIGTVMFACVVLGVVAYLLLSIQQINLNRRQSNFIDSVTHELKSPIASLKLYLQTLGRRNIGDEQRQDFYRSMLMDVDRLDQLINHLLDVARFDHHKSSNSNGESRAIRLDLLLAGLADLTRQRYGFSAEAIKLDLEPIQFHGRELDLNILFRNLIDNAAKYASDPPKVSIVLEMAGKPGWLRVTISDNGPGIPRKMRRRVFGRFVRLGNELERTKTGTGLGLFLVRSVLRQLKGRITLDDLPKGQGTRFDVWLPNAEQIDASGTSVQPDSTEHVIQSDTLPNPQSSITQT
jgi:two-component system, OmpR family, phosphate regulon sensor histidine kinase PhoR